MFSPGHFWNSFPFHFFRFFFPALLLYGYIENSSGASVLAFNKFRFEKHRQVLLCHCICSVCKFSQGEKWLKPDLEGKRCLLFCSLISALFNQRHSLVSRSDCALFFFYSAPLH